EKLLCAVSNVEHNESTSRQADTPSLHNWKSELATALSRTPVLHPTCVKCIIALHPPVESTLTKKTGEGATPTLLGSFSSFSSSFALATKSNHSHTCESFSRKSHHFHTCVKTLECCRRADIRSSEFPHSPTL